MQRPLNGSPFEWARWHTWRRAGARAMCCDVDSRGLDLARRRVGPLGARRHREVVCVPHGDTAHTSRGFLAMTPLRRGGGAVAQPHIVPATQADVAVRNTRALEAAEGECGFRATQAV